MLRTTSSGYTIKATSPDGSGLVCNTESTRRGSGSAESPRGKAESPRGGANSPRGKAESPRGGAESPRGKAEIEFGRPRGFSRGGEEEKNSSGGEDMPSGVGIISDETSAHFLVKQQSAWISVPKSSFFSLHGERLSDLRLEDIKNKKVSIAYTDTHTPEAYFLGDSEEASRTDTEGTDRDFYSDYGIEAEEETERAMEMQTALTTELLTDIAVLSALANDPQRSQQYLLHRAPKIKKSINFTFASLHSSNSGLYALVTQAYRQLIANMTMLTNDMQPVCEQCTRGQSRISLSCGHRLCMECGRALVQIQSSTEFQLHQCPVCQCELTLTDSRLLLLEKYEALKRGMNPSQESGIGLSQLSTH